MNLKPMRSFLTFGFRNCCPQMAHRSAGLSAVSAMPIVSEDPDTVADTPSAAAGTHSRPATLSLIGVTVGRITGFGFTAGFSTVDVRAVSCSGVREVSGEGAAATVGGPSAIVTRRAGAAAAALAAPLTPPMTLPLPVTSRMTPLEASMTPPFSTAEVR